MTPQSVLWDLSNMVQARPPQVPLITQEYLPKVNQARSPLSQTPLVTHRGNCPSWPRLDHHRPLWSHTGEFIQVGSGWTTTGPSSHTVLPRFSPCSMLGTFIFQNRFIIAVHCSLCNPFISSVKKKYKENNSSHIFWSL